MFVGIISGVMLVLVGTGACWRVTAAAARGHLPRNGGIGLRTRSTTASDAAWTAGHRAALPTGRATGIGSLVIGSAMIVESLAGGDEDGSTLFWVLFAVGYGGVLLSAILATTQANRAARATSHSATSR